MNNPKISVIVPVYNVEQFLPRCINSILAQTFTDFEVLLINDGSTDNSGRICDEYAKKDNRIRLFHKGNGGVSSARNIGLKNVKGELICFIDSDDYLDKKFLQRMVKAMEENDVDLVCCGCYRESTDGTLLWKRNIKTTTLYDRRQAVIELFTPTSFVGWPWNKIYKASLIKENGLEFNETIKYCEDDVFVLQYILHIQKACYISDILYHYVENSMSANFKGYTDQKFNVNCLDRQKADEMSYLLVRDMGDKEVMDIFLARRFTSNLATLYKLLPVYNDEHDILVFLKRNLRKYYLKYLLNKRFCKRLKEEIKHIIFLINPLIYIKIKLKR